MKVKDKKTGEIAEAGFNVCSVSVLLTFKDGRICNIMLILLKILWLNGRSK